MKLVIAIPSVCRQSIIGTLLSLNEQTDKDFSILIVKDSDKDLPKEVFQFFDPVVIEGPKEGWCSPPRNTALNYARGKFDWLAWVDDDDFLHPKYVEWLRSHSEKTRADIVLFRAAGLTDHLPQDYVFPEAHRFDLVVGFCTHSFAINLTRTPLYSTDISTKKGNDILYMKTCLSLDLNVIISNHVAYGIRKPCIDTKAKFPLVQIQAL